eukprot:765148-Hanusia_phi.AAC.6
MGAARRPLRRGQEQGTCKRVGTQWRSQVGVVGGSFHCGKDWRPDGPGSFPAQMDRGGVQWVGVGLCGRL